jgi:hypothetical protein
MRRGNTMTKSDWHEVEVDVTIDVTDVIDFIEDYASKSDLDEISNVLNITPPQMRSTVVDVMKLELIKKASVKYTLEELEELLNLQYI